MLNYLFSKLRHFNSCCIISEVVTIVVGVAMLVKLNYSTTILLVPIFVSCILLLDNMQPYIVAKLTSNAVFSEEEKHRFQQITFFLSTVCALSFPLFLLFLIQFLVRFKFIKVDDRTLFYDDACLSIYFFIFLLILILFFAQKLNFTIRGSWFFLFF